MEPKQHEKIPPWHTANATVEAPLPPLEGISHSHSTTTLDGMIIPSALALVAAGIAIGIGSETYQQIQSTGMSLETAAALPAVLGKGFVEGFALGGFASSTLVLFGISQEQTID